MLIGLIRRWECSEQKTCFFTDIIKDASSPILENIFLDYENELKMENCQKYWKILYQNVTKNENAYFICTRNFETINYRSSVSVRPSCSGQQRAEAKRCFSLEDLEFCVWLAKFETPPSRWQDIICLRSNWRIAEAFVTGPISCPTFEGLSPTLLLLPFILKSWKLQDYISQHENQK